MIGLRAVLNTSKSSLSYCLIGTKNQERTPNSFSNFMNLGKQIANSNDIWVEFQIFNRSDHDHHTLIRFPKVKNLSFRRDLNPRFPVIWQRNK